MAKRGLDICISLLGIIILSPVLLLAAILIKLTSRGSCVFLHERAGKDFTRLKVYKFRTMVQDASKIGGPLTLGGHDPRITRIGHLLRKTKLDELPQLFNVLFGHMSLVGPRPEAWQYVEMFREDFAQILKIRPGITDPASIRFRDEGSILEAAADPEDEYINHILPEKIQLAKEYIQHQTLLGDLRLVLTTVTSLFVDRIQARKN